MRRFYLSGLCLFFCLSSSLFSQAADTIANEIMLSLANPSAVPETDQDFGSEIEKILSDLCSGNEPGRDSGETLTADENPSAVPSEATQQDMLLPGDFREMVAAGVNRDPAVRPMTAVNRSAIELLDDGPTVENSGSTVGDPVHLYSIFEIIVDRREYTLKLFADKGNGEKVLLFDCRTGLGSAEYPTPRGTYYLCRIFDDKPLWIPPPSDWAIGESPSHSVYGGHMMPLFKKIPASSGKTAEVIEDDDILAPQMKMIDSGGYRVHGTNSPWSIGSGQSHGCVRLMNSNVKQLADTLKMYVGTTIRGKTPNGSYIALARPVKLILN